jgi:hypothetical protein
LTDTRLSLEHTFSVDDPLPLTTLPCYYVGHVGLEHERGPRLCVRVYRVRQDFVPQVGPRGFEPP